ncbi:hypothetical protein [Nocardioides sp. T2.26MG-1]|uniref:hypothetical protein n=1 Tax=Nocardioides sp. T2.26MG-1 TaxID=3041166 RepID=UPI00247761B6|nr:hypothetical protein [Nocardioides sp. T2.26MG-1]CAI9414607.1 hypothetical protein HIDPHFAB_02315 [Nocardioides sp. T2.26MG-1]
MLVRRVPAIVLSLVLGAAALASAPIALASDGGSATDGNDGPVRTKCDNTSWVRLNVKSIDNNADRFQVIGAVFSPDDDVWSWKMRHNGDLSAQGEVKARDDIDRSFRVSRTMLDFYGTDDVVFRAENQQTGEVCRIATGY